MGNQLGEWNLQIEKEFLNLIQISKDHNYIYRQTVHLCENITSEEWGIEKENDDDKYIVNEKLYDYLTDIFKVVPLAKNDETVEIEKLKTMDLSEKLNISKEIIMKLLKLKSLFLNTRI